jgi:membrane-associated phospholipid phosphatase
VFVDFLPLAALLVTWDYLRGICTSLGMPTWWAPQIRADRWLFGGTDPTVWLTEHLRRATPQWWDAPISLCYLSFFVLPLTLAATLWVRDRRAFYRWSARYVVLSYLAFLVFALAPTAPPWAAARCTAAQVAGHPSEPACMNHPATAATGGLLGAPAHPHAGVSVVERWSSAGLQELHLSVAKKVLETGQDFADRVAAVPSLHAGAALLVALFLWRRVRPFWRPVLALYPVLMGFSLVYTAEHYVIDVLAGYLFALLTMVVVARVERRFLTADPPVAARR